ncbi:hypothetical protein, partial [Cronobacter sakazakii]|uniref:hypothetical protein n=1 Tax=Cronobacter sakazakii TaxID=28141 RepID=UPI00195802A7
DTSVISSNVANPPGLVAGCPGDTAIFTLVPGIKVAFNGGSSSGQGDCSCTSFLYAAAASVDDLK